MSGTGVTQPKSRRGRVGSKPVDDYSTEKPFADEVRIESCFAPEPSLGKRAAEEAAKQAPKARRTRVCPF